MAVRKKQNSRVDDRGVTCRPKMASRYANLDGFGEVQKSFLHPCTTAKKKSRERVECKE